MKLEKVGYSEFDFTERFGKDVYRTVNEDWKRGPTGLFLLGVILFDELNVAEIVPAIPALSFGSTCSSEIAGWISLIDDHPAHADGKTYKIIEFTENSDDFGYAVVPAELDTSLEAIESDLKDIELTFVEDTSRPVLEQMRQMQAMFDANRTVQIDRESVKAHVMGYLDKIKEHGGIPSPTNVEAAPPDENGVINVTLTANTKFCEEMLRRMHEARREQELRDRVYAIAGNYGGDVAVAEMRELLEGGSDD